MTSSATWEKPESEDFRHVACRIEGQMQMKSADASCEITRHRRLL